ncbi:MAG TPA: hypothetical protein VFT68_16860 [Lapillicoccus sp.]|nr:hypothetical protein [Lapillicoccus sp.]
MSLDERHVTDALSRYAEGVVMTSTDMDRMQRDLHRRLQPPHQRRWRLLAAAAAALLLVAAIAGGAWWLRQPAPVPATPRTTDSLTGLWKFTNPLTSNLFVIRADGTATEYPSAQALVRDVATDPVKVTVDDQRIRVDFTDTQGRSCRTEQAIVAWSDGYVEQGVQTLIGPGCGQPSQPASTLIRLSPMSAGTRDLPVPDPEPALSVSDAVQLNGLWLLQGTGVVLAMDERSGPPAYLIDANGDIDTSPDGTGSVTIGAGGQVTLTDPTCGDTSLADARIHGSGAIQTLTVTVAGDPCGYFDGRTTLTWVKVL